MPIDPKIRPGVSPVRLPTTPAPAPVKPQVATTPAPVSTGFKATSTFDSGRPIVRRDGVPDDSVGRRIKGGVADDGVGRKTAGGVADDGVGRSTKGGVADDGVGRRALYGVADDGVGRSTKGGVADDGVGRSTKGGVADDGVGRTTRGGVADDGVGRTTTGGVADDGVGRTTKGGVADDGVGGSYEAILDSLVGRNDTPDSLALRNAIYERLETPSFLKGSATVPAQVAAYAKSMGLSKTQLGQVDTILRGASKETASLMGALLEKSKEVLTAVDSKGATALSNLARLAQQPLNPKIAGDTTRADLLNSCLRDIVNPNRVDQGDAPTCTVTSMQFELVADEPAEYARLLADLAGPDGRAQMRGGSYLEVEAGDAGARDGRSASDAIFQTAAMEFGNGRDAQFDPYAGKSVNATTGAEQRGLKPAQQTQVLRQLFGVNYESKNFLTEAEGAKALEKLRSYDTRGAQNRPVILQIDQGDFNHAVTFERVQDQRVYFRDPYGVLRSMPEAMFPKAVMAVNAPRDLKIV